MDNAIGYWLQGIPYIWQSEELSRYYILHINAAAVFDSRNKKHTIYKIRDKNLKKPAHVCLFPMTKCMRSISNLFYISTEMSHHGLLPTPEQIKSHYGKRYEIRLEGETLQNPYEKFTFRPGFPSNNAIVIDPISSNKWVIKVTPWNFKRKKE